MSTVLKPYKKEFDFSYACGAYAVIELLNARPEAVKAVYLHSKYTGSEDIAGLCEARGIPVVYNDRAFERVNKKENTFALGVFGKYSCELSPERPHVVLVNPGDMGNTGTIIRTMAGLNIPDLAVILPAADIFGPRIPKLYREYLKPLTSLKRRNSTMTLLGNTTNWRFLSSRRH